MSFAQSWEFAHRFSEQIASFFCEKLANERFAHGRSFLVSDLSDSLTSQRGSDRIAHKKMYQKYHFSLKN